MSQIDVPLSHAGFGQTRRSDNWWIQPLVVFLGLSAFIVYSTWAALQGQHFRFGPYLSPFYSPELFGAANEGWFGSKPDWMPAWVTAAMENPEVRPLPEEDPAQVWMRGEGSSRIADV